MADASGGVEVVYMERAIGLAASVRRGTSPNPWVGAVIVAGDEIVGEGATSPPGGPHAEVLALGQAGSRSQGATCYVTLEPCPHHGRTPPCVEALVAAGISRVVIALEDPDSRVAGRGIAALRAAGLTVDVGLSATAVAEQLAPYVQHRCTGRPLVVLKLAASLDGRIAAPDGSSRWITGEQARLDAHRVRADSDAILVGAGTIRADDPRLTVRLPPGEPTFGWRSQPFRVVLGKAPADALVQPALELTGDLGTVLDELGDRGVLQLLIEGGASVAHDFHRAGLVDRYLLYLAPVLFGGDDARAAFVGPGASSIDEVFRGEIASLRRLGDDLRLELRASRPA